MRLVRSMVAILLREISGGFGVLNSIVFIRAPRSQAAAPDRASEYSQSTKTLKARENLPNAPSISRSKSLHRAWFMHIRPVRVFKFTLVKTSFSQLYP